MLAKGQSISSFIVVKLVSWPLVRRPPACQSQRTERERENVAIEVVIFSSVLFPFYRVHFLTPI